MDNTQLHRGDRVQEVRGVYIPASMKRHLLQTLAQLVRMFPNEAKLMLRKIDVDKNGFTTS